MCRGNYVAEVRLRAVLYHVELLKISGVRMTAITLLLRMDAAKRPLWGLRGYVRCSKDYDAGGGKRSSESNRPPNLLGQTVPTALTARFTP